jgi:hypothetical protein
MLPEVGSFLLSKQWAVGFSISTSDRVQLAIV